MIATTATRYHVTRETRVYYRGRLMVARSEPLIEGRGFEDQRSAYIFIGAKLTAILHREAELWFCSPACPDLALVRYECEASLNTYTKFLIQEGNP